MPKVSVIIPTHNRAELLSTAISSVLGQTFEDWEMIIVDDHSTDKHV
jgi:glycosyltransferase involved in cell wall biosynthesis